MKDSIMIKVGGQFSGVGAFDEALKRLKIPYKNVYQAEWDKYARTTYLANNEAPEYYVEDVYNTPIQEITDKHGSLDIFMSSAPCQAFSLAGQRKGEDDERGVLFYQSHKFIKINKPRYFIFENVKGLLSIEDGKVFGRWLNLLGGKSINGNPVIFPDDDSVPYHIYWKVLNAKNYGVPQNRERVFIIGIRDDADNNFHWPVEMPLTKRLKDVLEDEVDEKYYLSEKLLSWITMHRDKRDSRNTFPMDEDCVSQCITARYYKTGAEDPYVKVNSATSKGYEIAKVGEDSINFEHPNSKTRRGRVGDKVAQTLTTSCEQGVLIGAIRGRNPDNPKLRKSGLPTKQMLEVNENGVSNCLTTVQKDNVVILGYSRDAKGKVTSRHEKDVANTIHTGTGGGGNTDQFVEESYRIRKLTPREAFRLMDFPDSFDFSVVSDSQAYKQAGNSIAVGVLENIINRLNIK